MAEDTELTEQEDVLSEEQKLRMQELYPVDAERKIISALMFENAFFNSLPGRIDRSFFSREDHARVYEVIQTLIESGVEAEIFSIENELKKDPDKYKEFDGFKFLNSLRADHEAVLAFNYSVKTVRNAYFKREVQDLLVKIDKGNLNQDPQRTVLDALRELMKLDDQMRSKDKGIQSASSIIEESTAEIYEEQLRALEGEYSGISTGFAELDKMTSGLQNGHLIIVAGRPGMGKTAFALNMASAIGLQQNLPVVIFSLEMTKKELMMRLRSAAEEIPSDNLKNKWFTDEIWVKYALANERIDSANIHIDDASALTVHEIRARARQFKNKVGDLGAVVVDYLQLMTGTGRKNDNRAIEVSDISRGLKALAKELGCPVIALSQLNRNSESRPGNRPQVSDLRESGAIEQDADAIFLLHRPGLYNNNPESEEAELIIGKQRSGSVGTIKFGFRGMYTQFYEPQTSDFDI